MLFASSLNACSSKPTPFAFAGEIVLFLPETLLTTCPSMVFRFTSAIPSTITAAVAFLPLMLSTSRIITTLSLGWVLDVMIATGSYIASLIALILRAFSFGVSFTSTKIWSSTIFGFFWYVAFRVLYARCPGEKSIGMFDAPMPRRCSVVLPINIALLYVVFPFIKSSTWFSNGFVISYWV